MSLAVRLAKLLSTLILISLTIPLSASAQSDGSALTKLTPSENATPTTPAAVSISSVDSARAALAQQTQAVRQQLEAAIPDSDDEDKLRRTLETLRSIDLVLEQQLAGLKRQAELNATEPLAQELSRELEEHRDKEGNVDFRYIEQLRDKLVSTQVLLKTADELIIHASERLNAAKDALKKSEKARRQEKELLTRNGSNATTPSAQVAIALLEATSQLAATTVELREIDLANEKLARQKHAERVSLLTQRIQEVSPRAQFTRAYLDDQITEIDTKIFDLGRLIESTRLDGLDIERRLSDARARLEQPGADSDPLLNEQIQALQMSRETNQLIQIVSTSRIQRLRTMATIWERRFSVAQATSDKEELVAWKREALDLLEQMRKDMRMHEAQLLDTRRALSDVTGRIDELSQNAAQSDLTKWLQDERKQLDTRTRVYEADIAYISSSEQLVQKFVEEISLQIHTPQFQEVLMSALSGLQTFWGYEFTSIDDSPITVSKLFLAIVLLILSFTASRRLSRFVGKRVVPRFSLNSGAAAAIQSLLFYLLVTCFALLALHMVHIPLTLFTFFGGALAIGVGFGAQHIINHFISGLVLLIEQPIRVGDIVELGGLLGEVVRIGARSTVLRTGSNRDIIVPNSTFLENNVINWTLADNKVRIFVSVGVMYGSPTRKVASLMRKAVEEHGRVLKDPAPLLLFKEFGDNALIFEIHFWVRIKSATESLVIESDVRYRIDNLFRLANIVIAFPQRDLHFDSGKPLEVRVLPAPRLQANERDHALETRFLSDETDA